MPTKIARTVFHLAQIEFLIPADMSTAGDGKRKPTKTSIRSIRLVMDADRLTLIRQLTEMVPSPNRE